MRKKAQYRRKKKQKPVFQNRNLWFLVVLVAAAVSLSYFTVFASWIQIEEVRVEGVSQVSPESVLSLVEPRAERSFLGFSTRSIFLFDARGTEALLLDSFPEMSEVSLKRSFPATLVVEITERTQAASWCQDSSCAALDREGIPFKRVGMEGSDSTPVFQSEEPREVLLGEQLMDPELLSLLLDFRESFLERSPSHLLLAGFELGPGSQVAGITRDGWLVLLDTKRSMEWQRTKLQLVLEQNIPEERKGDLEYVDLRFGDQAYIKYRD